MRLSLLLALALLVVPTATADVGMRPPLLRFPQAQALADQIVLGSGDLNAKSAGSCRPTTRGCSTTTATGRRTIGR
jgi:hypothetical protein